MDFYQTKDFIKNDLQKRLGQLSKITLGLVLSIGAIRLISWLLDLQLGGMLGLSEMKPTSAIGLTLLGSGLWCLTSVPHTTFKKYIGYFLAVISSGIGLLRLLTIFINKDITLDQALFDIKPIAHTSYLTESNSMAPNAAMSFLVSGIILFLIPGKNLKSIITYQSLSLLLTLIGLFSLVGHTYQVKEFQGILVYIPMTIPTTISVLLFSLTVLFNSAHTGLLRDITSHNFSGRFGHAIIPLLIFIPFFLGYLLILAHHKLAFTVEFAVAILMTSMIVTLVVLIWYNVSSLKRKDELRILSQEDAAFNQALLQSILNQIKDVIIFSVDKNYKYIHVNSALKAASVSTYGRDVDVGDSVLFNSITNDKDREKFKNNIDRALGGESHITIEEYGDLERSHFELRFNPLYNHKSQLTGVTVLATNVTERKEAEKRLLDNMKEISDYKFALDVSSIVSITSQNGIINHVNDNFCKISQYKKRELIGQDHQLVNSGYHSKDFFRDMWNTIIEGKVWKGELKNKAKDNTTYWIDLTIVPFLDGEGKPYQYVAIQHDITNRKFAENELKRINADLALEVTQRSNDVIKSERKFRALIESSQDFYGMSDAHGDPFYQSPASERMFGPVEQIRTDTIFSLIHAEDRECLKEVFSQVVLHPCKIFESTHRLKNKEGLYVWIEGSIINFLDDPAINAIVSNFRDVTERVKFEVQQALFTSIVNSSDDAIISKTLNGIITSWNHGAEIIFGYSAEEIIEKSISVIIPDHLQEEETQIIEKIKQGKSLHHYQTQRRRKDGSIFYASVTISPILEHGKVVAVSKILRDITELKMSEEKIIALNESLEHKVAERTLQLEIANRELESFSYSVAHDLRAPLRIIDGYSGILVNEYNHVLDNEGKRIIDVIVNNSRHMGQLIDGLLDFSRLARQSVNKQNISVQNLIKPIIEEHNFLNPTQIIDFRIGALEPLYGDLILIRQVFSNLISNAIKYSRNKEKPVIEIGCYKDSSGTVCFVKDNGAGFDIKYANKLFGVFQRLHRVSEFEGTGIGLANVHRIITRHGGTVWVEAEVDKGATFYFSLPNK